MWFSVLILMLCLCELFSEKASHVRIHSIHKVFFKKKMETHEQEKLPRSVGLLFFYVSGSVERLVCGVKVNKTAAGISV